MKMELKFTVTLKYCGLAKQKQNQKIMQKIEKQIFGLATIPNAHRKMNITNTNIHIHEMCFTSVFLQKIR